MKDAPITLSKEEFVSNMVQRKRERLVEMKDVPTMQRKEASVGNMVPKLRLLIRLAVMRDVPALPRMDEFVEGTAHHWQNILAAAKNLGWGTCKGRSLYQAWCQSEDCKLLV